MKADRRNLTDGENEERSMMELQGSRSPGDDLSSAYVMVPSAPWMTMEVSGLAALMPDSLILHFYSTEESILLYKNTRESVIDSS